jgi:aspartate aminotransferase
VTRLSSRVRALPASATVAARARATALKAQGAPVLDLTAGEPDRRGPEGADAAAREAIARGDTRYGPTAGLPELRARIAEARPEDRSADNVLVTAGAKQALHTALQAIVEPGDEVLLPTPCWVSFPALIELAGGVPVKVPCRADRGFVLDPDDLAAAITPRTRALLFNSPCNPTGAVVPDDVLARIAAVVEQHDLWLISDEIYAGVVYEGTRAPSPATLLPDRTLAVDGVSKAFAMTGWRVGWATGPTELIAAMARYQGQTAGGPAPPNQRAALAAMEGGDPHRLRLVGLFEDRMRSTLAAVRNLPGVRCHEPGGAIYLLPGVSAHIGSRTPEGAVIEDSVSLASYLLEAAHVALVAGEPFDAPGHVRISLVAEEAVLMEAVARIGTALASLR